LFSRLANLPDGHLAPRHRLLGRFLVSSVLRRLAPIHQPSPSSTSTPEVRVLPSTGITRLHRCRVGGGALDCSRAGFRPPLKLDVQFSRIQLSRRRSHLSDNEGEHRGKVVVPALAVRLRTPLPEE